MGGSVYFLLWFWLISSSQKGNQGRSLEAGTEAERWRNAVYWLALVWALKQNKQSMYLLCVEVRGLPVGVSSSFIMGSWNGIQVFMVGGMHLYLLGYFVSLKQGLSKGTVIGWNEAQ